MVIYKYMTSIICLLIVGYIYDIYKNKQNKYDENIQYELIRKYLLDGSSSINNNKPILWIHLDYSQNARNWENFNSRLTTNLNQPYLFLTISSIINHCGESFNIVIIDDNTFNKLIPDWKFDLLKTPDPVKQFLRHLAFTDLLYRYGGMFIPPSFICTKNLISLYNSGISGNKLFVGEFINTNVTSDTTIYYPDMRLIGCKKNNKYMEYLHSFLLKNIQYNDNVTFEGLINKECNTLIETGKANLITGEKLGVKTKKNQPVLIEELIGTTFIDFNKDMYGIYIPADVILKRTNYQWFARLNHKQVFESETNIGKLLLVNAGELS